jgi:hypothetical protein
MTWSDPALDRLLRAAAQAPKNVATSPSFALETRVLAHWKAGETGDDAAFLAGQFRRAIVCASLVMVLSIAWSWLAHLNDSPSKTALAKYALALQLRP